MITGSTKNNDTIISDCTLGGADAVNAMNGAGINARKPPTCLKAFLKSVPLSGSDHQLEKLAEVGSSNLVPVNTVGSNTDLLLFVFITLATRESSRMY